MGREVTPPPEPPPVEREPEGPRVVAWRLHVLIEAHYPVFLAEQLAADPLVDLHRAVDLTRAGCSFKTAARILL